MFYLLLLAVLVQCCWAQNSPNCSQLLSPQLQQEIASYSWLSQSLIDALLTPGGQLKGLAWQALARFTDKFGSRFVGTQNLEDAIDYMLQELTDLNFNNVHGEEVTVPIWHRNNESLYMLQPRYKKLALLGLGSSIGTPPEGITGEVLVVRNFDELDQRSTEVAGKIVVYNEPFLSYGYAVQYREDGANQASKYGAIATLVRSAALMSIYSPHTGIVQYDTDVAPVKIPAASITVEDAEMFQRMQDRGQKVVVTLYMEAENMPDGTSRNTVGEFGGRTFPEQVVVVSGHLDSWDVGQGAMDDGGGAFSAIYAAYALKVLGLEPTRTLRTILWVAEEQGTVGSHAYAQQHLDELGNFSIVMESDLGTFQADGFSFTGSDQGSCIMQEILKLASGMNATRYEMPDQGSDTGAFTELGVPGGAILNKNGKYFLFHHSNGDTMTVEDPDELDSCVAVTALFAGVLSNLSIQMPRD